MRVASAAFEKEIAAQSHPIGRLESYNKEDFYDITSDPHEWTYQIDNPKYATTVEELRALIPSFEDTAKPLPSAKTTEHRAPQKMKKKEKNKTE